MTNSQDDIDFLLNSLRSNIKSPNARGFIEGLFSSSEIPELALRLRVRDAIQTHLRDKGDEIAVSKIAKECYCSKKLVKRVLRAVRDQYPPAPSVSGKFTIALPKEERAQNLVEEILKDSGFAMNPAREAIIDKKNGMAPVKYRVMRGADMPVYLKQGIVSAGFLGNDKIHEVQSEARIAGNQPIELDIRRQFRINSFRMCLAAPKGSDIKSINDLRGKTIATTYVSTLKHELMAKGLDPAGDKITIMPLNGGVEAACTDFGADAIMDIVETGGSLKKNGLVVLGDPLYKGDMSFIAYQNPSRPREDGIMEEFLARLVAA